MKILYYNFSKLRQIFQLILPLFSFFSTYFCLCLLKSSQSIFNASIIAVDNFGPIFYDANNFNRRRCNIINKQKNIVKDNCYPYTETADVKKYIKQLAIIALMLSFSCGVSLVNLKASVTCFTISSKLLKKTDIKSQIFTVVEHSCLFANKFQQVKIATLRWWSI